MPGKASVISGKEHFDALMALVDFRLRRRIDRAQHEWRLSFAVWALLVAATYYVHPRPPNVVLVPLLSAVVAFHFLHVAGVRKRNRLDTEMTFFYADRAEMMLHLPPEGLELSERPIFNEAMKVSMRDLKGLFTTDLWSSGIEVMITVGLACAAFWLMGNFHLTCH